MWNEDTQAAFAVFDRFPRIGNKYDREGAAHGSLHGCEQRAALEQRLVPRVFSTAQTLVSEIDLPPVNRHA